MTPEADHAPGQLTFCGKKKFPYSALETRPSLPKIAQNPYLCLIVAFREKTKEGVDTGVRSRYIGKALEGGAALLK